MSDLTPTERLYISERLLSRARHESKKLLSEHPCIDRLSVMMTVLGEMTENEHRAGLAYAADFYGLRVCATDAARDAEGRGKVSNRT